MRQFPSSLKRLYLAWFSETNLFCNKIHFLWKFSSFAVKKFAVFTNNPRSFLDNLANSRFAVSFTEVEYCFDILGSVDIVFDNFPRFLWLVLLYFFGELDKIILPASRSFISAINALASVITGLLSFLPTRSKHAFVPRL